MAAPEWGYGERAMRWGAALAAATVLLAGCGGSERAERSSLAELAPRDAALYGEMTLRPSGPHGLALRRFAGNLLGTGTVDRDELAELLVDRLDAGLDFEEDVAPWLGERAGFFLAGDGGDDIEGAVLLETKRPERAARFLRRRLGEGKAGRRIPGGRFWPGIDAGAAGVVRDRVVLASSEEVLRASSRAAERGSLAETDRYREAAAPMDGRRPAAFVVAGRGDAVHDLFAAAGGVPPADLRLIRSAIDPDRPVTVRARATATDAIVEVLGFRAPPAAAPPIDGLPADAWIALSSGNLGETLTTGLTAGGPAAALRRATFMPFSQSMLRALGRGSMYLQAGDWHRGSAGEILADVSRYEPVARGVRDLARKLRASRLYEVELDTYRGTLDLSADWASTAAPVDGLDIALRRREITVYFGQTGSADTLGETSAYKRAERVLGGPPTTLLNMREMVRVLWPGRAPGAAGRFEMLAAQEKRLPDGGLRQRYAIGLREVPREPAREPPKEPA